MENGMLIFMKTSIFLEHVFQLGIHDQIYSGFLYCSAVTKTGYFSVLAVAEVLLQVSGPVQAGSCSVSWLCLRMCLGCRAESLPSEGPGCGFGIAQTMCLA